MISAGSGFANRKGTDLDYPESRSELQPEIPHHGTDQRLTALRSPKLKDPISGIHPFVISASCGFLTRLGDDIHSAYIPRISRETFETLPICQTLSRIGSLTPAGHNRMLTSYIYIYTHVSFFFSPRPLSTLGRSICLEYYCWFCLFLQHYGAGFFYRTW